MCPVIKNQKSLYEVADSQRPAVLTFGMAALLSALAGKEANTSKHSPDLPVSQLLFQKTACVSGFSTGFSSALGLSTGSSQSLDALTDSPPGHNTQQNHTKASLIRMP